MHRRVTPELLDTLSPGDSRAMASRRDLARINIVMRQAALMAARLRHLPAPQMLVDLGSGDGKFLLAVARRLEWDDVRAVICDRHDIVSPETKHGFEKLGWQCEVRKGDIFETLKTVDAGAIVTANLFLHHFHDPDLKRLLHLAASRAHAFVACEPRRSLFAMVGVRLLGLMGANKVTRHDAKASVHAGFHGAELTSLWPGDDKAWRVEERGRFPFSHCFVAAKTAN